VVRRLSQLTRKLLLPNYIRNTLHKILYILQQCHVDMRVSFFSLMLRSGALSFLHATMPYLGLIFFFFFVSFFLLLAFWISLFASVICFVVEGVRERHSGYGVPGTLCYMAGLYVSTLYRISLYQTIYLYHLQLTITISPT
jgi:hypothetical protein